jgi:hypothetical protein
MSEQSSGSKMLAHLASCKNFIPISISEFKKSNKGTK